MEKTTNKVTKPPRLCQGFGGQACGLCGKTKKPRYKTECCGNWVCGNENEYVMFSYSRDICSRNHRRFTLCGSHHAEEHRGDLPAATDAAQAGWKTCKRCREDFEPEMYVWYGTNEYNFEKLPNPPAFEPTHCSKCGERIVLPDGGYSNLCGVYRCDNCPITGKERGEIIREYENKKAPGRNASKQGSFS